MPARKLTPKQAAFVQEYIIDLNGSAAYRRAGYKAIGHAAEANASRLLRNAEVAAAIVEAQAARAQRTQVTADEVLARLWEEANGHGEDSSHSARVAALKLYGMHFGLFPQRHQHESGVKLEIVEEIVDAVHAPEANGIVSTNGERIHAR
jgi:hypothetical protein